MELSCHWLLELVWVRTKSLPQLAQVEWVMCTKHETRALTGLSR